MLECKAGYASKIAIMDRILDCELFSLGAEEGEPDAGLLFSF